MTDFFTPLEKARLDGAAAPAMSMDFADRLLASLPTEVPPLPERAQLRVRSRLWKRAGIALLSVAGAGAVSVAAATTLFGVPIRNVPVVGSIVETVSPAKQKIVEADPLSPKTAPAPVAMPKVDTAPVEPAPDLINRRELQVGAMAERIADRLDQHDQRRREAGLPPRPPKLTPEMLERLGKLSPEERRALFERVNAIRTERGTALARPQTKRMPQPDRPVPRWMTPEERAAVQALPKEERRAYLEKLRAEKGLPSLPPRLNAEQLGAGKLQAYLDSLSPEERQMLIEEMKRRRAEKRAKASEGNSPPERSTEEPVVQPLP